MFATNIMAKKKIAELVIDLTTNMANFQRDLNSARKEVRDFGESLTGTFSKLKSLAVVAGEAFAVTQTFEFVHKMTESMEALGKAAQKAGVTVEAMSSLTFAAHMADVDADTLSMGLTKLSKAMLGIEQSPKMTAAKTALQQLGVETSNLKSADEVMLKIADRFSKMEDGARKTGLAMEIFGKSGAQLIPFLNQGSAAIEHMEEEARRLGIVLDKDAIERAEKFEDSLKLMKAQAQGVGYQFVQQLLPALNDFMTALSGSTDKMSAFAKAGDGMAGTMRQAAILAELARAQWNRENLEGKILGAKMDLRVMQLGTAVVANPEAIEAQKKHIQDLQDQLAKSWDESGRNLAVLRGDIASPATSHNDKKEEFEGIGTAAVDATAKIKEFWSAWDELGKHTAGIIEKSKEPLQRELDQVNAQISSIREFMATKSRPGGTVVDLELNRQIGALEQQRVHILDQIAAKTKEAADALENLWKSLATPLPENAGSLLGVNAGNFKVSPAVQHEAGLQRLEGSDQERGQLAVQIYEQTRTAAERYADMLRQIQTLQAHGDIDTQTAKRAIGQLKEQYDTATIAARDFGETAGGAMRELIMQSGNWQHILLQLAQQVIQIGLKMAMMKMPSTSGGGVGGFFGAILGGFAGFRASGGDVESGKPYLVGERGPEPFIPRTSGTVLPNDFLRSSSGNRGGGNTYIIDARDSNAAEVEMRVQRAMAETHQQSVSSSIAAQRERDQRRPSRSRFG